MQNFKYPITFWWIYQYILERYNALSDSMIGIIMPYVYKYRYFESTYMYIQHVVHI